MNLVDRVKNIILSPKSEWEVIATEETSVQELYINYALILVAAAAVAEFIGRAIVGFSVLGAHFRTPIGSALVGFILRIVLTLVGVFVLAYIIDALAPSFNGEKDILSSHKLAVYSSTPGWVGGLLMIIPPLGVLGLLFALYGIYILYLGATPIKKVPSDKAPVFTLVVVIVSIVIYWIVGMIVAGFMVAGRFTV